MTSAKENISIGKEKKGQEEEIDLKAISSDGISSKSIVKYVEPKLSVTNSYNQLAEETNLNLPPPNWLKEFLPGSFTPSQVRNNYNLDLSSLYIAGRYPEMFSEVDVVSASKHIKKLLKTPFSQNSSYSMSVHRIGNSLVLNDFDIPLFLKTNQFDNSEDLKWLYDLYCIANNESKDEKIYPKKKNKELSQLQMIESKFMYYSIEESKSEEPKLSRSNSICKVVDESDITNATPSGSSEVQETPSIDDFPSGSSFLRDVLWTFEDITMLVGSDLPIFGGGKYPAVSLRLRDASKPINVLTGIDYWLDNLMCNVPELMMCYHLKGIVQKYEKIKTEELPFAENNQFSPKIVKDVAQNILSFLKSNCTKEGHTYWLFKSNKDDVIKLYDLTSISAEHQSKNPFSLSVALLLYKIAYNMYVTYDRNDHNVLKMVALLENCVKLLKNEECNEILIMANYLLADLYSHSLVTSTSTIESSIAQEDDFDNDSSYTTDDESLDASPVYFSVEVKTLCEAIPEERQYKKYEYLNNNLDEEQKCKNSIEATIEVLKIILRSSNIKKLQARNKPVSKLELTTCNEYLNDSLLSIPQDENGQVRVEPFTIEGMKSRLLHLIAKCYLSLVRISLSKDKFGRALRFLQILFRALADVKPNDLIAQALMYYGDSLTMLASRRDVNIDAEKIDFLQLNANDENLLELLGEDAEANFSSDDFINIGQCFSLNFEDLLTTSLDLYEESLTNIKNDCEENVAQLVIDITRRLGNIRNEIGVLFLNKAFSVASKFGMPKDSEMSLWKTSYSHFEKGIKAFDFINDKINMALLYSNSGKLMRLCAQVYGNSTKLNPDEDRGQFTQQEETYFKKAFEFYNKALGLVQDEASSDVKHSLMLELSGAYFSMGSTMQDNAPLQLMAEENVVKRISSAFVKSLHYVEIIPFNETNKTLIANQIGNIHHKLASLYHHVLRNQISEYGKKNYRSLAELHYNKVYNALDPKHFPVKTLQVIMEHLAFYDYLLSQGTSPKWLKSKHEILFKQNNDLRKALQELSIRSQNDSLTDKEEVTKMVKWLYGQFSSTLKETIKCISGKQHKNISLIDIKQAKQMFEKIIREKLSDELSEKLAKTNILLENLQDIYEKK